MGGYEVFEHVQAFMEVRLDRQVLDESAERVGHQAAHARELLQLAGGTARAGFGHHEERIERINTAQHRLAHFVGSAHPQLAYALRALTFGNSPVREAAVGVGHFLFGAASTTPPSTEVAPPSIFTL
jgi:hypothetical protein